MRLIALCLGLASTTLACGAAPDEGVDSENGGKSAAGAASTSGGSGGASAGAASGGSSAGGSATAGATNAGAANGGTSSGGTTTVGGAGNGGTGGSGAPHVVTACDALPEPGAWENITPSVLVGEDTPGGAILVDPSNTATVYAGSATGGGLFKSTDCGATFNHINTGTNGTNIDSGNIWDMVIDPEEPETLYVIEGYGDGGLWKTTNGGVDWVNTTPGDSNVGQTAAYNFTSIVSLDPEDHLHLVLAFHSGCSGDFAPNCQAETTDGGASWRLFKAPVAGEGVGVVILGATTWVSGAWDALYRTNDSGATWDKVSSIGGGHWQRYRDGDGVDYIGTSSGIIKSSDGDTWTKLAGFDMSTQGITGDGVNILSGQQWGTHLYKVPLSDPASASELPATDGDSDGPYFMTYDADHKILYASEFQSGHWRLVME